MLFRFKKADESERNTKPPELKDFTFLPFSEDKLERIARNFALLRSDILRRRTAFKSKPLLLEFSVNNLCNLRCIMCPNETHQQFRLPSSLVKEVLIEKLFPSAMCLMPSAGGEPFLGDIELLGEGCRKHEVQLNLITNGTQLTRERLDSIASIIGCLQISFDGHHAELYESIRQGAEFEKVKKNVALAAEYARREGFELSLSAVYSNGLSRTMPEYVDFAAGLGADSVIFQRLHYSTDKARAIDAFQTLSQMEIAKEMEKAIKGAEKNGIDIHFDFHPCRTARFNKRKRRINVRAFVEKYMIDNYPDFCFMAATYMNADPEGIIFPCCIGDPALLMGNLFEKSLKKIWRGKPYRLLRKSFQTRKYLGVCAGCPHRHRGHWQTDVMDS